MAERKAWETAADLSWNRVSGQGVNLSLLLDLESGTAESKRNMRACKLSTQARILQISPRTLKFFL